MDINDLKAFELDFNSQFEFMKILGLHKEIGDSSESALFNFLVAYEECDKYLNSLTDISDIELSKWAYSVYQKEPLMSSGFNSVISKDKRRPIEVLSDRYELKKYGKIAEHAQKCRSKYLRQGDFEKHLSTLRKGEGLWSVDVALRIFKMDKIPDRSLDKYQNVLNQLIIFKGIRGAHLIFEFLRSKKYPNQQIKFLFKEWKSQGI